MPGSEYVIAQFSDIHCGDRRFDAGLMEALVDEINALSPDLVAVPGDLTEHGYPEQFAQARDLLDRIRCPNQVVVPGNHDARNVGIVYFDEMFGARCSSNEFPLPQGGPAVRVLGADTSRPDLNQGELGRPRHMWLYREFGQAGDGLKILVMHHHLVSVPGTGRERNILWDAGDLLEILSECQVDLVLCGHKHVPYVWGINGMVLSTSGTACTRRTRGKIPPSFNIVRIRPESIQVTLRNTGRPTGRTVTMPRPVRGTARARRGLQNASEATV